MNLSDIINDSALIDSKIQGVIPGVISNNQDPKKLGRVRVVISFLGVDSDPQGSNNKGIETDWAPVMSFAAGKKQGGYFLPEIEDEVLVAFLYGDVNRPYVMGALWNAQDIPPQDNADGKNNIKQITTRSGNTLLFDDTENDAKIKLFDKDQKDEITISSKENTITIKSSKKINLTCADGEITIEAKEIKVNASSSLNLQSKSISIKSSGSLSLEGSSVSVKSSGSVSVKGSVINLN